MHLTLDAMDERRRTLEEDGARPDGRPPEPSARGRRPERDAATRPPDEPPSRPSEVRPVRERTQPGRRPSEEHPTPHAPFAELIGRSRFVVLLAVAGVLLVSISLFLVGAGLAVKGTWTAVVALVRGDLGSTSLTVELLEIVSVMLKAVVFYLIGVGFYSLFIAPLNLTAALGIDSFNDLEIKIVSVVIVILAITFLEHFILWEQPVEVLLYGISLAVVVGALVLFQLHSHRASREDRSEIAPTIVEAQRKMFHQDVEEREVTPEAARVAHGAGRHEE